jgi:serine/threonine-protein kinase
VPPAIGGERGGPGGAVDAVLAKALAKRPDDRYGSCLAFVGALRAAVTGGSGPPAPPPGPPGWARPVFPGAVG